MRLRIIDTDLLTLGTNKQHAGIQELTPSAFVEPLGLLECPVWRGLLDFFFSSRRRHTRYIGDWSSDVCSSDLLRKLGLRSRSRGRSRGRGRSRSRSEERRVGKECSSGWAPVHNKKKDSVTG